MNKITVGTIGLSIVLLLGIPPTAARGHDGQGHQGRHSEYGAWDDPKRYDSQYEDGWEEDEEYYEDVDQSSSRRYPSSEDWERSAPRERSERRW